VIVSERLELVPLSAELLEASLARDLHRVATLLEANVPGEWLDEHRAMRRRLAQLRADPSLAPWLLRGMITRRSRVMVGRIGFHTAPDPDYLRPYAPGGIELGYTVFAP
jgi:ribosomal-protein-alanine N-acetyltransferase